MKTREPCKKFDLNNGCYRFKEIDKFNGSMTNRTLCHKRINLETSSHMLFDTTLFPQTYCLRHTDLYMYIAMQPRYSTVISPQYLPHVCLR